MKALTILQQSTPPHITIQTQLRPQTHRSLQHNLRKPALPPPRTWRLHDGAKGFTSRPRNGEPINKKSKTERNDKNNFDNDEKLPEVVWERMISRILFYVGVPLGLGFALLQGFSVVKERELWDVPKWLPFLTTFITFGASTLGIAYGSLSTSLDAEKEGSLLGFEQVEKNWDEMWKEENESGNS